MKSHLNFSTPHFDFTSIIRYSLKTIKSEISKFKNFYCEIRWAHINPYSNSEFDKKEASNFRISFREEPLLLN